MASKTLVTTWDQDQGGSAPNGHRNVQIVITEVGNDLRFDVTIISPLNNDDLRALFFNVKDDAVAGLTIKESWVADVQQSSNFASRVDANAVDYVLDKNEKLTGNYDNHKIKNSTFDVGVEFPGSNSNITSASFTLTGGDNRKLTLDLVSEELFGIRVHGQKLIIPGPNEPDATGPGSGGSEPTDAYDDLIEAGDGDDIIHGGRGNDEMQGEAGNDTIIGGTDRGRLEWSDDTLTKVTIGDNLYGNDGSDTYFYAKGDGVDLIWDFRPDEDTVVLGYESTEIIGATFVGGVTNRIDTPNHDKIALILGRGATTHDAIIINDFGGLRDSTRAAFVFADGRTLSMKDIIALAESTPVPANLPETWSGVPGSSSRTSGRTSNSLDLFGSNDAEVLIGRAGDDRLYGNEGFNQLNGNGGLDELYGGNVSDVLLGGAGNDLGYGNGGADTIVGGTGSDKLYGGGGADIIYGDTDSLEDGRDLSYSGFNFRFNLGLEEKYRALFQSGEPVDGISVRPGDLVITPGKNWWGGFEVTLTVKAEASLGNWSLFLNSAYEITSIWGAELSRVEDGKTSDLYELKNAPWNGKLAKDQTTTIGFTVRTPFDRVVESKTELLKGLKIGTEATLDQGVASAISDINKYLNSKTAVTVAESYTLTGNAQKLAAVSGTKAIDLTGNKLDNTILGNDGANEIAGRAGKDVLTGRKGKDAFAFDAALSKSNVDTITDFNVKDDKFYLDNSIFKKLGFGTPTKPKQLKKNFFSLDKAKDKNDHLIYDKKKGVLLYDADGSDKGQALEFTKIKAGLELKFSHFYII